MKTNASLTIARVSDCYHIWPSVQADALDSKEFVIFLKDSIALLEAALKLEEEQNVGQ